MKSPALPVEVPISHCPRCGSSETVRPKLLATNVLKESPFIETFVVEHPAEFQASPHSMGDHFVAGLFCDQCELGFIPDAVAKSMGIEPSSRRGCISQTHRPFCIGYPRSDASYRPPDGLHPFAAIVWQPDPDAIGVRITLSASSLEEALRILKLEQGPGAIITLWSPEDEDKPR